MSSFRRYLPLLGYLLVVLLVSAVGGWVTAGSVGTWYVGLAKPTWNPPGWVFAPVWSALYLMMAFVAWRLGQRREDPVAADARRVWWVQLGFNAIWSPLFFGLHEPAFALIDILFLLGSVGCLQFRLLRTDRLAALLWLPYLAWVTFATALNMAIVELN